MEEVHFFGHFPLFLTIFHFFSNFFLRQKAKFPEVARGLAKIIFQKGWSRGVARGRAGSRGCGRPLTFQSTSDFICHHSTLYHPCTCLLPRCTYPMCSLRFPFAKTGILPQPARPRATSSAARATPRDLLPYPRDPARPLATPRDLPRPTSTSVQAQCDIKREKVRNSAYHEKRRGGAISNKSILFRKIFAQQMFILHLCH